jgi:hypothetical protein
MEDPAHRGGERSTPAVARSPGAEAMGNAADRLGGRAGRRRRTERTEKKNGEKGGRCRWPAAFSLWWPIGATRRGKRQGGPGVRRRVEKKAGKRERGPGPAGDISGGQHRTPASRRERRGCRTTGECGVARRRERE